MNVKSKKRWLKAEMHAHCNLDPKDYSFCLFSPEQLIQEAARHKYDIVSITCHDTNIWTDDLSGYAQNLGITLIPGVEVTAEKTRHVLVYNLDKGSESLDTLEKIRKHTTEDSLVVAPHPFYPGRTCLRNYLEENPDLFDAVEYSGFVTPGLNFNRRLMKFAEKTGKPVLGFGDIHHLWQLGRTYTWIYAEPDISSILHAIKRGLIRMETKPLSWFEAAGWFARMYWKKLLPTNPPLHQLDEIENRRCLGPAQKSMKSQRIHVGQ